MSSSPLIRTLADRGGGVAELGGKGDSLARLAAAGLPVPGGFHITTAAYRSFVTENALDPAIQAELHRPERIAELFESRPIPPRIARPIVSAYADLGGPAVAVRSSATAEDLPGASFAGQQETFLNVHGADALLDAVRRCWASLWTERAIAYRARQDVDPATLALAVVVQRLVDAEASGIAFTADPVSGSNERIEINSAWGLGEAVVGGEVTPDSFSVDAASGRLRSRAINAKEVMTVRSGEGTLTRDVPPLQQRRPSLTIGQAERLAHLSQRIADLYGTPVDVEFCRVGDELSIVQARPITTIRQDPWNDSRRGYFLWTNTNTGEAMPDVLTPATWSMVQLFLRDVLATSSIAPHVGYGRIGGRIYLNLSVLFTLSHVLGVSENRFRQLTEEVFGRIPDDLPVPLVPAHRLHVLRSTVPVAWNVLRTARRDAKSLTTFLRQHPQHCLDLRAHIDAVTDPGELAQLWRDTVLPGFHRVSQRLAAATRSSGASFVTTRQRLQQLVGDEAANAITAGMGGEDGDLASLGLLEGLDQLARGRIDTATFNTTYGHRGPHEFEIALPRPGEQPDWAAEQLAAQGNGGDYRRLLQRQERARETAWIRLERRHPWQAKVIRHQLTAWSKMAREREWARSETIRYFWVLRAYALRAGELSGLGADVFFLSAPEIAAWLDGTPTDRGTIEERKAAYERYRALPNYPAIILGRFDPFAWAAESDRRSDRYVEGVSEPASDAIRGFPGSAGVVEGTVRVISDAADGHQLLAGEILVTTVTNVGWTPMFPRAAAVVTDVGAPLSHAAIVARELGIPAVVGCGNATMLLQTGDQVRVDGSAGTVEALPRAS